MRWSRLIASPGGRRWRLALVCIATACAGGGVFAQAPTDSRPAFQLSSRQIFTTRTQPSIYLTFARITSLDMRVYKVIDPIKFFSTLEDPHVLGSPEPVVAAGADVDRAHRLLEGAPAGDLALDDAPAVVARVSPGPP